MITIYLFSLVEWKAQKQCTILQQLLIALVSQVRVMLIFNRRYSETIEAKEPDRPAWEKDPGHRQELANRPRPETLLVAKLVLKP